MSDITQNIKSYKLIYPQIYSYTLPNRTQNNGSQKIGYTERKDVDARILEQVRTAAFSEDYTKLWSAPAFFKGNKESFIDTEFHSFLEKNGRYEDKYKQIRFRYFVHDSKTRPCKCANHYHKHYAHQCCNWNLLNIC